ncbi:WD40 repeat domain-containing serine/threonine-protein kinase [Paludisphaera mucosa]|uniref:Serine/threonine-protein kinase n=1 Tax=Paludisphaera mucosa TaxID=3030827 RepID=A0ABT6FKW2_9BACT|nr:serine/threonine-protein kinase [Paludisphaera mucosa]MDG3008217.1 serine/threonine-protein kinase [Paludisphaera mucosa]
MSAAPRDDGDAGSEADPLIELAGEFAERHRRGEQPSLSEFAERFPHEAERIHQLFPAMILLERHLDGGPRLVPPPPPGRLGEYRIVREIGQGGMGVVYEAVQESLGRHVALKVLPMRLTLDARALERFRREARIAAQLHHTNIVPVFGVGESDGIHYFAMQFIQGRNLASLLEALRAGEASPHALLPDSGDGPEVDAAAGRKPCYYHDVARIGVQVADALAYAHQQGVLHRDVKPANLLLDAQGTAWVTDFGLAKLVDAADLTMSGDLVGTVRYLAPERLNGSTEPGSDVYGLGLTLYELLTLRPAFPGGPRGRLVRRILDEEPPRPRKLIPTIPRDLETIILKAIAKDPRRRYRSASELRDDLGRFLGDRPIAARRATPPERAWRSCRRNPALSTAVASALALLLLVAVGAVLSAGRLNDQLERTGMARQAERDAKRDALEKLVQSQLARAQAGRYGRRPGQRLGGLEAIAEATRIAKAMDMPAETLEALRDEAVACMALPDLRPGRRSIPWPDGTRTIEFPSSYDRYARLDEAGGASVRRMEDDAEILKIPPLGRELVDFQFSPDGRFLAIGSAGEGLRIWGVDAARPLFPGPLAGATLAFSEDGGRFAFVSADGSIRIHDLPSGSEARRLPSPARPPRLIAFHPDGRRLATAADVGESGLVVVWDSETGSRISSFETDAGWAIRRIAWDPGGRLLAIGFGLPRNVAQVWDVASGRPIATMEGHTQDVERVVFHPEGHLLLTLSWDGTGRIWEVRTGRPLLFWPSTIFGARFSRDGTLCGCTVIDGEARLIEASDARDYRTPICDVPKGPAEGDIDEDGLLVVGTVDGVRAWDLDSGRVEASFAIGDTVSARFIRGRSGLELLTCGAGGIRRWPIVEGEAGGERLRLGEPRTIDLPFVPSTMNVAKNANQIVVACEASGEALVIDLDDESRRRVLGPHPALTRAALSPDGRWATTSGWHTPFARVWDVRSGACVKQFPLGRMNHAAYSMDGRTLVVSNAYEFNLIDSVSFEVVRRIGRDIVSFPSDVAFSPDLRTAALESSPGVIHLIDGTTGRTVMRLEAPHSDRTRWLGFTTDGARLVAISGLSRTVNYWDLRRIRRRLKSMGLSSEVVASPEDATTDRR